MKYIPFLVFSICLFFTTTSHAADIPPHLSGLTGQLVKAVKEELKNPSGSPEKQALIEKAYKHLKSRSIHRFAGKGAKGSPSQLEQHHEIELENGEKIEMDWDPESGEFNLSVGKNSDGDDAYRTDITGKTKTSKDKDGNTITEIDTAKISVTPKNAKDLRKDTESIAGKWVSDKGDVWQITPKGVKFIELAWHKGSDGYVDTYTGTYWKGQIKATSPNDNARDFKDDIPMPVKQKLLGYATTSKLDLKFKAGSKNEELSLAGKTIGGTVHYQPDTFKINKVVRDNDIDPLRLTRDIEGKYQIGSLDFNIFNWYTSQSDLLELIQKYETDLDLDEKYLKQKQQEREKKYTEVDALDQELTAAKTSIKTQRAALQALEYPKGSERLRKRLKSRRKGLFHEEFRLGYLQDEYDRTSDKDARKDIQEKLDRLAPTIALIKEDIAKYEAQIAAMRPKGWEKKIKDTTAKVDKLEDDINLRLPWAMDNAITNIVRLNSLIIDIQNRMANTKATLAPLKKTALKYKNEGDVIKEHGGLITDVIVTKDGSTVFAAKRDDVNYKKFLRDIDKEIAMMRDLKTEAQADFNIAQGNFVDESRSAQEFLSALERKIWNSALGQVVIEGLFVAADMAESFGKGGIFGVFGFVVYEASDWYVSGDKAADEVDGNVIRQKVEADILRKKQNEEKTEEQIRLGIRERIKNPPSYWTSISKKTFDYAKKGAEGAPKEVAKTVIKQTGLEEAYTGIFSAGAQYAKSSEKQVRQSLSEYVRGVDPKLQKVRDRILEKQKALKKIRNEIARKSKRMKSQKFQQEVIEALQNFEKFKGLTKNVLEKSGQVIKDFTSEAGVAVLKEATKSMAKKLFVDIEVAAWHNFFHQDYLARQAYGYMVEAREYNWHLEDELNFLLATRKTFVETHDANSGFKIVTNIAFNEDAKLEVKLLNTNGQEVVLDAKRAQVTIQDLKGKASGAMHIFEASSFTGDKGKLPLRVLLNR